MYRNTWLEINLDAYKENCLKLKKKANKDMIAVVKANAYGCGDHFVIETAKEAGAKMLAVSSLDEALILRNEQEDLDILILGYVCPKDIPVLIENKIQTALVSKEWLKEVLQVEHAGLMIHLKYDTGMNRIGVKDETTLLECFKLCKDNDIEVMGIFTHFALSDDPCQTMTKKQYEQFEKGVKALNVQLKWVHCSNSDAIIDFDTPISNACRFGIAMYGYASHTFDLKPVLSLYSEVVHTKFVKKGETIGYGATYTADEDCFIATLSIGYADGFLRKNQGRKVYINGHLYEIVGRVCMDQCMVKVDENVHVNDRAEIFGTHISLESMAKELDTIVYEIMTNLNERLTRVYIKEGKVLEEVNTRLINSKKA